MSEADHRESQHEPEEKGKEDSEKASQKVERGKKESIEQESSAFAERP
jgi:hypothetical protein